MRDWKILLALAGAAAFASVLVGLWIANAPDVAGKAGLPVAVPTTGVQASGGSQS